MNPLHEYFKKNFAVKKFTHIPCTIEKQPIELTTETIKGKRFYVLPDGKKYPSITTVLSERGNEGITKWRESVGEQVANNIMRNAAKRGTAVHTLTEIYLNNRELTSSSIRNGSRTIPKRHTRYIVDKTIRCDIVYILNSL